MKQCPKCKKVKAINEFHRDNKNKDAYNIYCKECEKTRSTERYSKMRNKFGGLYTTWGAMKARCYYPKNINYSSYGGRGITVCEEWKDNFIVFYAWAKGKHKKGLQIDRRNNDGNYCPENCRFVTRIENSRNTSFVKLNIKKVIIIKRLLKEGKLFQREIGKIFGVKRETISGIKRGKSWTDVE